MISANDLRKIQLNEVASGYSVEEVNAVINEAASTIEAYTNENKELYHKLEVLAGKIEEYRTEEDSIKTALIMAQKMADKVKQDSNNEAEQLLSNSKMQAETTVNEANAQAERIVNEAREFSSSMIKQKTDEANAILADAEKKSNDAINSSKIVAQNILDQAKEISDDLVKKSQEEKEAYDVLVETLRRNASSFIDELKNLYNGQLESLNAAKLYSESADAESSNLNSVQSEVKSLVGEIDDMKNAIPAEIHLEKNEVEEPSVQQAPVAPEETARPFENEAPAVEVNPAVEKEVNEEPVQTVLDGTPAAEEIRIIENEPVEETDPMEAVEAFSANDEPVTADPMQAVKAFSADEITPIDKSKKIVPEITEEPELEEKLPFENYFHLNKADAHLDKTQTISLVPPDDDDDEDDEPKRKGFFHKKK